MIEIDRAGERIHLRSPFDPQTVKRCKTIPGWGFSKTKRAWTFPLSIETCLLLREAFGSDMEVARPLRKWYRAEAKKRAKLAKITASSGIRNLPVLRDAAPKLHAAMQSRPYQPAAAKFIVKGRKVLLADDPGLGKTLEVIGGIIESGVPGPHLVVSPKIAATTVWPREIPRWSGQEAWELPEGRPGRSAMLGRLLAAYESRDTSLEQAWICVHPEVLLTPGYWLCRKCDERTTYTRKPTPVLECGCERGRLKPTFDPTYPELMRIQWGAIVVDECHETLIRSSGTPTQRRNGLDLLRNREGGLRIAVSGTPFRNRPQQLWGVLNWLDSKRYSGYWRWVQQYWAVGGFSGWEVGAQIEGREKILWNEVGGIMLRRTKAEVAPDLPPKTYVGTPLDPTDENSPVGIWLDMGKAQARAYRQMQEQGSADVKGGLLQTAGFLSEVTRLTQLASAFGEFYNGEFMPSLPSNKYDWLEDFLEQMGIPRDPTGKVVVVSQYTRLLKMMSFGLTATQNGMGCMLTGDITGKRRAKIIEAFNRPVGTDSPHVMFLNVAAGGVAITIDSADDMVMLDEATPDTMTQVEDRIHRVSNPRPVRYHYLRSAGTVDVGRALTNAEVSMGSRRLLDGRRGVEYYRNVLEKSHG